MTTLPTTTLIDSLVDLLTEAYAGPPDPRGTWFVDNEPDSGIFGAISGVSAAEASRSVDGSGKRGSTIASNVEHLRWSLAIANRTLQGAEYQANWKESWDLINADEAAWNQLRQALRTEYETLLKGIKMQQDLQGDFLLGVLAMVPHAAFHLGILRQMIERVRAAEGEPGKGA